MDLTEAALKAAQDLGVRNASVEDLRNYIINKIDLTPIESVVAYKHELQRVGDFKTLRFLESEKFFKEPMNNFMKQGINRPLQAALEPMLKYLMKHGARVLAIEIKVPHVKNNHMAYYSKLIDAQKDGHVMVIEWNGTFRVIEPRFVKGADEYMRRVANKKRDTKLTSRIESALSLTWANLATETGHSNFKAGKIAADKIEQDMRKVTLLLKMYPEDTLNEEDIRKAYKRLRDKYPKSKVSLRMGNDFSRGDSLITFWILNTHEGKGCHWYAMYHFSNKPVLKMFDPRGGEGQAYAKRRNEAITRIRQNFNIKDATWSNVEYQVDSDQYNCGVWCLWKARQLMQGIDDKVLKVPFGDGSLSEFTNASEVSIPILRNMVTNNYVR